MVLSDLQFSKNVLSFKWALVLGCVGTRISDILEQSRISLFQMLIAHHDIWLRTFYHPLFLE